jgi:hypothetical protein
VAVVPLLLFEFYFFKKHDNGQIDFPEEKEEEHESLQIDAKD